MNDRETTVSDLKEAVHQLCLRKGWGEEGVQNPQQVAMAMTVEMSELLAAMGMDKKSAGKALRVICLHGIGACFIHPTDVSFFAGMTAE